MMICDLTQGRMSLLSLADLICEPSGASVLKV